MDMVLKWVGNGLTSCSEIAEEMGLSKGAVSKMATKLIELGRLKMNGRQYALP
jgi:DNA-binding IclR family transcriptional regulator